MFLRSVANAIYRIRLRKRERREANFLMTRRKEKETHESLVSVLNTGPLVAARFPHVFSFRFLSIEVRKGRRVLVCVLDALLQQNERERERGGEEKERQRKKKYM